ncbi:Rcb2.42 [Mycena amicta]|nr:Rcb2.42 [Mycena amicta]
MHYELPIGAFLGAALVLVPLPWHWRARNVPTLSIIAWLFVSNITMAINSIIWADSIRLTARVWCDITTKITIGATMSLPACCLCLCIHLERIASVRQVSTTVEQKRRRMFFDIAMCWGLPALIMILHYVVQGHRFDIIEDFGCFPAIYVSVAAICILYIPVLIVILLTIGFASVALYHFFQRRLTFARHLHDGSSALTPSRYFRLMAMALVQMLWATAITVFNMFFTISTTGVRPWISWADVHSDFGRIGVYPRAFTPESFRRPTFFTFWAVPATAFIFFIFFAFGQDAVKEYKAVVGVVRRVARIPEKEKKQQRLQSIPSFVTRFPQLDRKGGSSVDSHTTITSSSKHAVDFGAYDIPLTPASGSSFGTVIAAYGSHGPAYTDDGHRDSFYKPPPPHFPADVGDMA